MISTIAFVVVLANTQQPYAGEQERTIKALSAKQIEGYRSGAGMGQAKAAELNGYPGPKHVLELAEELALSEQQISQTRAIERKMQAQSSAFGRQLIELETALDEAFSQQTIDRLELEQLVRTIGAVEAAIRLTHLRAHLEQFEKLTEAQRVKYAELRGYQPEPTPGR